MNNLPAKIDNIGKLPPQAVEVEEVVIASLMLESNRIEDVIGIINIKSFYKNEHQTIFRIIKELYDNKKNIDLLTVTQELKDKNLLDEVGGAAYITSIIRKVSSAAHIEAHAKIIAEKFYQRETIRMATQLIDMAYSNEDVDIISSQWLNNTNTLENIFTVADTGVHIKEVLANTVIEIEKDCVKVEENKTPGIPTGFVGLDTNTGGWRDGNLNLLAARPGVGKTSMALQFILEAAKSGYWVNVFSYEMLKEDLARIIIARESEVDRSNVRDGYIKNEDWKKINITIGRLEKLPIIFIDSSGLNVHQLKSIVSKNKKNGRCDFVVVDYLQLIKTGGAKATRELEVAEISGTLKNMALTKNIPVLALSQLNREADKGLPKLSNLRESGVLEQDADLVIFLVPEDENEKAIRLIVEKHRRGKVGDQIISHNEQMTKFWEQTSMYPEMDENITYWQNEF